MPAKAPYEKLDPEFKRKWVAALRSGEYQQGSGSLKAAGNGGTLAAPTTEFLLCCLGVACDVYNPNGWVECADEVDNYDWQFPEVDLDAGELQVCEYNENTLPFISVHDASTLISMNDDDGANFEVIADFIEENL